MTDVEKLAKGVVLTTLGATAKEPTAAEKRAQQQKDRLTATPAVKQEIDQMTKRLSRLPPAMQSQLAKKFAAVGESRDGLIAEGFDSVEDRDSWIKKNRKKLASIWIMDTLEESESSKDEAKLVLEHHIENGIELNQAVKSVLESRVILTKHLKAALKDMHVDGAIDINKLSVKL
jgi:hypothetical protein